MNLQEIKDKFETRTKGGYALEILAYKEDQHFCVIAVVFTDGGWVPKAWTIAGKPSEHPLNEGLSLVAKKESLPKDILCEVWDDGEISTKAYSDGVGGFYSLGRCSKTQDGRHFNSDNHKILKQDPKPWFNDAECPIPKGLKFRVFTSGRWLEGDEEHNWTWYDSEYPITAYQILGED